jgi:cobalt-zinc-cadmium efflux system membrane fusion protein
MKSAVALLLIALLFPLSNAHAQSEAQASVNLPRESEAAREIVLTPVTRKPVAAQIDATAVIEPDAGAVAHITSQIPARVVELVAQPGQQVKKGETLVMLSSIELGQAKAEYLKTRSLAAIAGQNLKREEDLYQRKIAPMKDLLAARAARDTAIAQFKTARETLRLLIPPAQMKRLDWSQDGIALSEFPLTSPIDGTLVKRDVTLGATIDRNSPPLVVINLERVWVMARVYEHALAGLQLGEPAKITVEAYPGQIFAGKVAYIGDEVDRTNRTVLARIDVANPEHLLKPGMFAHAEIAEPLADDVLVAPESAVFDEDGRKIVFVADHGSYSIRNVTVGKAGDGKVEIVAGLRDGDRVVSRGGLVLKGLMTRAAVN